MRSLSIIVPTLNEGAQIAEALRAAQAAAPGAELIVADGGSADRTPELARAYAPVVSARRGRALQMNAGAMLAHGEVLLFQHADTLMPPGALELVRAVMADPQVLGGAFAIRFDEPGWMYERMGRDTTRRSLSGSYTGDQCMFVRREAFWDVGGYPRLEIMEDVELSDILRRRGPVRMIDTPVVTSARRHRKHGPLKVLVTGWYLQILYKLGMPEFGLHRLYYGRPPE